MGGDFMDEEDSLDELEGSDLSGCEDEEEDEDNTTQSEVITDTFEDYMGHSKSFQQKFSHDHLRIGRNLVCK